MKAKHVFTTLGIAFAMGIGVAAAANISNNIQPAKADGVTTLYLDTNLLTWYGDQSRAYLYGDSQNNTWPGQPLTQVSGSLYKLDVENMSNYHSVIFLRSNGTNVWNRTSKDGGTAISLPTDWTVANKFTFNDDWDGNTEYNDGNYTGSWSFYNANNKHTVNTVLDKWGTETVNGSVEVVDGNAVPAPAYDFGYSFSGWFSDAQYTEGNEVTAVTSDMTVYGKITKVATKSFSLDASLAADFSGKMGVAIYAWEPSGKTNAEWPGVSTPIWAGSITLPEDASFVVCNGTDKNAEDFTQTVDVSFAPAIDGDTLILLDTKTDGKVDTAWESEGVATNNYTVKCDGNTYSFALADTDKPEGVVHQFKATISDARRANVLEFYQNGTLIESDLGVDYDQGQPVAGNNIIGDLTNGFRVYHRALNMDVYLKVYSDGGRSLWGAGYEEEIFRLKTNSQTVEYAHIDNTFEPSGDYIKQYKTDNTYAFEDDVEYVISDYMGTTQNVAVEDGDNNAKMVESYLTRFTVYNDCSENLYIKIKADLSITLWIGGKYHARTLSIDGTPYQMEVYEEEGQPLQYRLTGVHLFAGQTISYSYDGTPVELTAKAIGNNNLTSDLVTIADATSADIYLNPADNTIWVGGLGSVGGFHLLITNVHTGKVTFVNMAQNPDNASEYFIAAYAFKEGDAIQIIDCSSGSALPTRFNPAGGLNQYSNENFEVSHGEVVCTADVTVNAYIQLASGADKLYFGSVPEAVPNALTFVANFYSHMRNACGQPVNKGAYVKSAWKNNVVPDYNELSADAKAILDQGGYSPYQEIREFAERYIYFMQVFGEEQQLANFMGWEIPAASNQYSVVSTNNSVIMIAVISAIVVTSSAGLFFIIRRKKFEK